LQQQHSSGAYDPPPDYVTYQSTLRDAIQLMSLAISSSCDPSALRIPYHLRSSVPSNNQSMPLISHHIKKNLAKKKFSSRQTSAKAVGPNLSPIDLRIISKLLARLSQVNKQIRRAGAVAFYYLSLKYSTTEHNNHPMCACLLFKSTRKQMHTEHLRKVLQSKGRDTPRTPIYSKPLRSFPKEEIRN